MTIAQRMTALAARIGTDTIFSRDDGATFTAKTGPTDVDPDEFAGDTQTVVRNPIALILPNAPAIAFPPELGALTIVFDYLGTRYTLLKSTPKVLAGEVQYWRLIGGV
jgi:hypothetical protein